MLFEVEYRCEFYFFMIYEFSIIYIKAHFGAQNVFYKKIVNDRDCGKFNFATFTCWYFSDLKYRSQNTSMLEKPANNFANTTLKPYLRGNGETCSEVDHNQSCRELNFIQFINKLFRGILKKQKYFAFFDWLKLHGAFFGFARTFSTVENDEIFFP